ncbi:MAG: VOC family protein [Deltaproteobacteria bacterium]|nr:MAG: VOC family protein [Deltaproteobacteria bacterium]
MAIEHGVIKQIAYVVDDLDAAIASWVEIVHAGPFFRIDNAQATDMRYRGDGAEATLSLAVGNSGGVQIELIQLMDGAPSVYRELPRGVHHLALLARDFEAESARLERLGHPVAWALTLPGICRVRYHDTLARFGHFIELWESTETFRAILEMVEDAARGWDGRHPVRRFSP